MKVQRISLRNLRNDSHFQFHTELFNLLTKTGADFLKIVSLFELYKKYYFMIDEARRRICAEARRRLAREADRARDEVWSGLASVNFGCLGHSSPAVREAARRLNLLFDARGNVAGKLLGGQFSAARDVLEDLEGEYAGDVLAVGLSRWVLELRRRHDFFEGLAGELFDDEEEESYVVLREARDVVDAIFADIREMVNALLLLEGEEEYEGFVSECNSIIARYKVRGKRGEKKRGQL